MEYIYSALLLHSSGQKIDEASLKKVMEAAGAKPDVARVKALVSSLDGVDIEEAIANAAVAAAPTAPAASEAPAEEKKEEKSAEQDEKKAEEAAAGLGSLFG
jgi:large subunit ribosomal protein L12